MYCSVEGYRLTGHRAQLFDGGIHVTGFAKQLLAAGRYLIGADDDRLSGTFRSVGDCGRRGRGDHGGGNCLRFTDGQALGQIFGGFAWYRGFVEIWADGGERETQTGKQFASIAGRRGQNQCLHEWITFVTILGLWSSHFPAGSIRICWRVTVHDTR